jgi:hypothetical protein
MSVRILYGFKLGLACEYLRFPNRPRLSDVIPGPLSADEEAKRDEDMGEYSARLTAVNVQDTACEDEKGFWSAIKLGSTANHKLTQVIHLRSDYVATAHSVSQTRRDRPITARSYIPLPLHHPTVPPPVLPCRP